jgi:hypothetical protein
MLDPNDPRYLKDVFDQAVTNAKDYLHAINQHQIPFFKRLLAGFETLIHNTPETKGQHLNVCDVDTKNGLCSFVFNMNTYLHAETSWNLQEVQFVVAPNGKLYVFDKNKTGASLCPNDAVVTLDYVSRLDRDVMIDLRSHLAMVFPDTIGSYLFDRTVALAAGEGQPLEEFKFTLGLINAAPR